VRYWIDPEDRLADFDDEWKRFARDNGAGSLAEPTVIGLPLSRFISDSSTLHIWRRLLVRIRGGRRFELEVRCDGPDRRRRLRLASELESSGAVRMTSELLSEETREPIPLAPGAGAPGDLLVGCSWCNRFELEPRSWVEAEELIERRRLMNRHPLPGVTHGICPDCQERLEES